MQLKSTKNESKEGLNDWGQIQITACKPVICITRDLKIPSLTCETKNEAALQGVVNVIFSDPQTVFYRS